MPVCTRCGKMKGEGMKFVENVLQNWFTDEKEKHTDEHYICPGCYWFPSDTPTPPVPAAGKAPCKWEVIDMEYDCGNQMSSTESKLAIKTEFVRNRGDTQFTQGVKLVYSLSEKTSWSFGAGLTEGVEVTGEAGIPLVANGQVTGKVSGTMNFSTGGEKTETISQESSIQATIEPRSAKKITVWANNKECLIPFVAKVKIFYNDGSTGIAKMKGVCKKGFQCDCHTTVEDIPL